MNTTVKKITQKKYIRALVFMCSLAYFVSYLTRINYSAVLVEIMKSEGYLKPAASIPLTGLFIVYGVGQLISGVLGDKFSPEKIVFCGLLITSAMNILLPFVSSSVVLMTVTWSINGFAQALMWPPLVKIMARYLTKDDYSLNIVYIGLYHIINQMHKASYRSLILHCNNGPYITTCMDDDIFYLNHRHNFHLVLLT